MFDLKLLLLPSFTLSLTLDRERVDRKDSSFLILGGPCSDNRNDRSLLIDRAWNLGRLLARARPALLPRSLDNDRLLVEGDRLFLLLGKSGRPGEDGLLPPLVGTNRSPVERDRPQLGLGGVFVC